MSYELKDTYKNWDQERFYAANHAPSLSARTRDLLWSKDGWSQIDQEKAANQVDLLLEKILGLKNQGLTGARVFMSFLADEDPTTPGEGEHWL